MKPTFSVAEKECVDAAVHEFENHHLDDVVSDYEPNWKPDGWSPALLVYTFKRNGVFYVHVAVAKTADGYIRLRIDGADTERSYVERTVPSPPKGVGNPFALALGRLFDVHAFEEDWCYTRDILIEGAYESRVKTLLAEAAQTKKAAKKAKKVREAVETVAAEAAPVAAEAAAPAAEDPRAFGVISEPLGTRPVKHDWTLFRTLLVYELWSAHKVRARADEDTEDTVSIDGTPFFFRFIRGEVGASWPFRKEYKLRFLVESGLQIGQIAERYAYFDGTLYVDDVVSKLALLLWDRPNVKETLVTARLIQTCEQEVFVALAEGGASK